MSDTNRFGPTGQFPHGKLDPTDEGELNMGVSWDPRARVVRIAFGRPVAWLAMTPEEARALAALLLAKAAEGDPPSRAN